MIIKGSMKKKGMMKNSFATQRIRRETVATTIGVGTKRPLARYAAEA
jgi:hypothetical protein